MEQEGVGAPELLVHGFRRTQLGDAGREMQDVEFGVRDEGTRRQSGEEPGEDIHRIGRRGIGKNEGELVAADPGSLIDRTQIHAQYIGEMA